MTSPTTGVQPVLGQSILNGVPVTLKFAARTTAKQGTAAARTRVPERGRTIGASADRAGLGQERRRSPVRRHRLAA
jgi:hypothetical protein